MPRTPKKRTNPAQNTKKTASRGKSIAGQWRGRQLEFPEIDGLRPTGNRIRETLFNWLMPYLPGSHCLDAFSGSGALGFEALSRGARSVDMLEPNLQANQQLQNNAKLLQADNLQVLGSQAQQWLAQPGNRPYNIAFIDPPFDLDLWPTILPQLEDNSWLASEALIYIETPKNYQLQTPSNWQQHRSKIAGQVCFSLYQRIGTNNQA